MAAILLALLLVLIVLLYKCGMGAYGTFKERGIPHDTPWPFIGNLSPKVMLGWYPFLQMLIESSRKFQNCKFYGYYNMREAFFVLHDLDLIKKVGIQEFEHFTNHRDLIPASSEALFTKSLMALKDDKWREMRMTLTPSFTGSKLKAMFELINECSLEGVRYIEGELVKAAAKDIELEMKDYFGRYANDVIASAAFGIKVNSFVDKKNQFYVTGQSVAQFSGLRMLKIILYGIMPRLMKALRVSICDKEKIEYFNSLVFDSMQYRREHNIVRLDMIHLLMEAKRQFQERRDTTILENSTEHAEFNDVDLLAQCLLFFFVGFETMSNCLCYLTYELCMNPNIQEQLYEEILGVQQELQGKSIGFNMLGKMKYMDMVVSELLRLWPPAFSLDRVCGKDIDIKDDNTGELLVKLKKGDIVVIPIIAIQRDPKYFADPELFKPERFSEQNKKDISPFTYLPFGVGPRSCIGNRMALMEVKSIIYHLLSKFKLVPAKKNCQKFNAKLEWLSSTAKREILDQVCAPGRSLDWFAK